MLYLFQGVRFPVQCVAFSSLQLHGKKATYKPFSGLSVFGKAVTVFLWKAREEGSPSHYVQEEAEYLF